MEGGWRHEQDDRQRDQTEADDMGVLRGPGQLRKAIRQNRRQLKPKQRLGAWQYDARLSQHLLDLVLERRALVLHRSLLVFVGLVPVAFAPQPLEPVPQEQREYQADHA